MYIGQTNRRRYTQSRQSLNHHGMSTIEIVVHNDESYVLKLCDTSNPKSRKRFPIELKIHSSLHHLQIGQDGIVPFVEPIQNNDGFVMHFIEYGSNLVDWYDQKAEAYKTNPRHPNEEPFDLTLQLLWRLTRLICMLHDNNIIHNDIKPANFLICDTPNDFRIYVLDFGIARRKNEKLDASGGTLGYTAPECFQNINNADESSDIFSVIICWLSALFPNLGFDEIQSVPHWNSFIQNLKLPQHPILFPALRQLLESMLKPQAQRRHRSSRSFFNALSDCLFFGTQQLSYLERFPSPKDPNRLLGWHDHIINKTDVPTIVSRPNLPKFHSTIHGIACLHFAAVTTDIEWINPIHSGQQFVQSSHRLGGNILAHWKGPQKGAYADVYPKNHTTYPAERVLFPAKQVPQQIQVQAIVKQHGHTLVWYGVRCTAQTHIQLYSFVQPRILYRFGSSNGLLTEPLPISNNNQGTIYIVWDSALLRFLDVYQYIDQTQSFQSISHNPHLQQLLPNIRTQIQQQHAFNFPLLRNKITQQTTTRIQHFIQVLQRSPLRTLAQYITPQNIVLWEQIGLLYQLLDHPLYKNIASSIPGTLIREMELLLIHLTHYNIRYQNIWCLQFYNSRNHPVKPLYPLQTVNRLADINTPIEYYWDCTTTDSLHTLSKGSLKCETRFFFTKQGETDTKQYLVSIYPHAAITIGRWNTQKPPHFPLPLHPTLSERIVRVAKEGTHIEPHCHNLVKSDENDLQVFDNTTQFTCTKCGLLQSGSHTTCARQSCNSMLRIHQHMPVYNLTISRQFHEQYSYSTVVEWQTSSSSSYCVATQWFSFEDGIFVVIHKNRLGLISDNNRVEILSKSKGRMSIEPKTLYPLYDIHMIKTLSATIKIHH